MSLGGSLVRRLGLAVGTFALVALGAGAQGASASRAWHGGNPLHFVGELLLPGQSRPTLNSAGADYGKALAVSSDGRTAVVGGFEKKDKPAVWVLSVPHGQQFASGKGVKVAAVPSASAALSANGKVALVGTGNDAAWVFTNRGGGVWVGTKLKPAGVGNSTRFGESVALSRDGRVAIVGGPGGKGAVWTFIRPGTGNRWVQVTGKLTGKGESGDGGFGSAVALSADGTTAIVGAPKDDSDDGAAWFYTRSGSRWVQQGSKQWNALSPTPVSKGSFDSEFGRSVALSADGSTALIGAWRDYKGDGAVYVYTRSGSTWSKVDRLPAPAQAPKSGFGRSVALSGDGSNAVIGAPRADRYKRFSNLGRGAAFVFLRSGPAFVGHGKLTYDRFQEWDFAVAVALSSDGNTALVTGHPFVGGAVRDVEVFESPPYVERITPDKGPAGGGTSVTISGSGFNAVRAVTFGSAPAASYHVDSPTQITAVSPSGQGTVDIRVSTSIGTSNAESPDDFRYLSGPTVTAVTPSSGPSGGGTPVTINGTGLYYATHVHFGSAEAQFKVNSDTEILAYSPPGVAGQKVTVTVTTPGGTSGVNASAVFTYIDVIL
jgi:IPT/TIG domain/FG-GAP repeat